MTSCLEDATLFSSADKKSLKTIPKHIAVIMDGNRRWARARSLPLQVGHARGAENLRELVKACIELGVETLTAYSFSTENIKRSASEIKLLLSLFKKYLVSEVDQLIENGVRLFTIGDLSFFPSDLRAKIEEAKEKTAHNARINLVLALNYGARDEIKRAVSKIAEEIKQGKNLKISEKLIEQYLDTAPFRDPDLLIRTSGEYRLSNFLLWQISYTEIYFSKSLWPDFSPQELLEAVKCYQNRTIRRGK